jgi:hypothetical protein
LDRKVNVGDVDKKNLENLRSTALIKNKTMHLIEIKMLTTDNKDSSNAETNHKIAKEN